MTKKVILPLIILPVLAAATLSAKELEVSKFLENALKSNPSISNVSIEKKSEKQVQNLKGWKALNIAIKATVTEGGKKRPISETSTYFTNGRFIANSLTDMQTGELITLEPEFLEEYYLKENLISGTSKSKHKIAIFSDPLCPFCKKSIPKILRVLKKQPNNFAVYYYDFPLDSIHPAARTLVQINEKLRHGKNRETKLDSIFEMYDFDINARETNEKVIVDTYNKEFGYELKVEDINTEEIKEAIKKSFDIAMKLGVKGTPSLYVDGIKDGSMTKYKKFIK